MLTTQERMNIVTGYQNLPVGQMCRKLEYPVVTVKELEDRFAVHAIASKFNSLEEARVINEVAGKLKITSGEALKRISVNLKLGTYRDSDAMERQFSLMARALMDWRSIEAMGTTRITAKHSTGKVVIEALDAYMGDDIPARVLESLEVAKEAGLTDFFVAYPVIEVKEVEIRQEQQKDPVLLAKLGDKYLEIDMWE